MAFEAFLTQGQSKPTKARWLTSSVSLIVHGGLLVALGVYSFWHVDELSPPTVTVTFLSAAPPPPPPPPPKRKSSPTKTKPTAMRELVQPKPGDLLQPKTREQPKPEEKDDGVEGGVEGGIAGGVVGGALSAPKPEQAAPKILPNNIGSSQMLTDPNKDPRYRIGLPPQLNRPGFRGFALIKICVSKEGVVTDAKIVKPMDPSADPLLKEKAMTWKYKPYDIDGRPVPFCYVLRYDLQVESGSN